MRLTALSGLIVLLGLAIVWPQLLAAQDGDPAEATPDQKEARGPLPDYFGKLGVSNPQREKLYAVQESYEQKLVALRRQIEQLEAERDTAMEALLTPGQKLRLKELREEARQRELDAQAAAESVPREEANP